MSGEVVTIFDELKEYIREVLGDSNNARMDSKGWFYTDCYVDYRDEFDDEDIADILAGKCRCIEDGKERIIRMAPTDVLTVLVERAYEEQYWSCRQDIINELVENSDIARIMENFNISEENIGDYLDEIWEFKYPYEHFGKQEVCLDIMLDTGDRNYEFDRNNLDSVDIEAVEDFDDNSSLLWLCEQQGVTREELLASFNKGTAHSDEVVNLRKEKNKLVDELKKYGYDVPDFNRSAHHSGAYKVYLDLKDTVYRYKPSVERLKTQIKDNDVSFEEYQKEFLERNGREAPLSKDAFESEKEKVLESLAERLEKAENILNNAQTRLANDSEMKEVARLCDARDIVVRRLSELSKTDDYKKAEFINSVHNECNNTFYGPNVVTFLVKMPLAQAITVREIYDREQKECGNDSYYYEERKGLSSIVIDKNVRCGLMDDYNGGGSVFELKLMKDVEVPVKALYKIVADKCNGNYGFMEIYGMNDEEFSESLKEIRDVELPKVNELISDAQDRVEDVKETDISKDLPEI